MHFNRFLTIIIVKGNSYKRKNYLKKKIATGHFRHVSVILGSKGRLEFSA